VAGWATPSPVGEVPASIACVRDFVNTTDRETGTDDIATPAQLAAFLHASGRLSGGQEATESDVELAHRLRRGLRRALELNHDDERTSVPELDAALSELPLRLGWSQAEPRLVPAGSGVGGALGGIVVAVTEALAEGTWRRLKICAADDCAWAYYDASKNRARNWCEYGCGNRIKVRAYRERRRAASSL
jgi:predicted RNA-binding Zn ribbon-like protein